MTEEQWPNLTHQDRDRLLAAVQQVGVNVADKWLSTAAIEAIKKLVEKAERDRVYMAGLDSATDAILAENNRLAEERDSLRTDLAVLQNEWEAWRQIEKGLLAENERLKRKCDEFAACLRGEPSAGLRFVLGVEVEKAIGPLQTENERLARENTCLRGMATKLLPCHYCGVAEIARCPTGFPGCALMDDLSAFEDCSNMEVRRLKAEVERLKCGDLTPEEFQALCHNLHQRPMPCTRAEFEAGCKQFTDTLFNLEDKTDG